VKVQTYCIWATPWPRRTLPSTRGSTCSPIRGVWRAEILMRTCRVAEAEPIWAAARADTPDDVWLYNTAGLEYAHAGDHATALDWLNDRLHWTRSCAHRRSR